MFRSRQDGSGCRAQAWPGGVCCSTAARSCISRRHCRRTLFLMCHGGLAPPCVVVMTVNRRWATRPWGVPPHQVNHEMPQPRPRLRPRLRLLADRHHPIGTPPKRRYRLPVGDGVADEAVWPLPPGGPWPRTGPMAAQDKPASAGARRANILRLLSLGYDRYEKRLRNVEAPKNRNGYIRAIRAPRHEGSTRRRRPQAENDDRATNVCSRGTRTVA